MLIPPWGGLTTLALSRARTPLELAVTPLSQFLREGFLALFELARAGRRLLAEAARRACAASLWLRAS